MNGSQITAILALLVALPAGAIIAAMVDSAARAAISGTPIAPASLRPLREAGALFKEDPICTERPDPALAYLAPTLYLLLAAMGVSVIPLEHDWVAAPFEAGIVLWGACEALTVVAVFLHGWAPNAPFPLVGAYRYVAIGLPVMLLSMFVLIGAALPAESLSISAIVEAQTGMWNIVRQPPGFILFLILGLSLGLRGPFDYADAEDLSGGTSAEDAGRGRLAWQAARFSMLVAVSAMAAAVFLGGYHGPVLPGPFWMALKTLGVLLLLILAGHHLPGCRPRA